MAGQTEANKTNNEDIESSIDASVNSSEVSGESQDHRPRDTSIQNVNAILYYVVAICAILCIAGAITAGVIVKRNKDSYNGPVYKANSNVDIYRQECAGEDSCRSEFGYKVRITADGGRIFVVTKEAIKDIVQVFDYNQTAGSWYRHSTIPRYQPEQEFLDLAVDRSGRRLVLSTRNINRPNQENTVSVYEEVCCSYWNSIGNITHDMFKQAVNCRGENILDSSYGFGSTLDMSADGNTIAVASPRASFYESNIEDRTPLAGAVRVFRHASVAGDFEPEGPINQDTRPPGNYIDFNETLFDPSQSQPTPQANDTWVPVGVTLCGYEENHEYGKRLKLLNESHIVLTEFLTDQCESPGLDVFNYMTRERFGRSLGLPYPRDVDDNDMLATSPDGRFIVVASANYNPSAYEEMPYQGKLEVYEHNQESLHYDSVAELYGESPFLHFGTSVAMADDYTIVVGTATTDHDVTPHDFLQVFRYQTSRRNEWSNELENGHFWIKNEFPFKGPQIRGGWTSIDIDADGKRIVAGSPRQYHDVVFDDGTEQETDVEGLVAIYDLEEN